MTRFLCAAALLAACGTTPGGFLGQQGSTLRNTDLVQVGIDEQRKRQAEEDAKKQAAENEQARINKVAQSAQAHVDLFEYPAAITDWKEAYRLSTNPIYMLRIGESQRAIGQCDEAQAMYQQYLDKTAGKGPDAAVARTRLDEAKRCQSRLGSNADKVHGLYKSASTHYELSEYDGAIKDFKEAYRLSEDPAYLFNIAQSYRLKGNCKEAMQYYERYLNAAGDIPNKARVEQRVAEMRACAK